MSRRSTTPKPTVARLRCAIYTRKSSEEGLDQSFNSLDAQREACEAYIMSQAGEGWSALASRYDDGGFSGGSMERPGLKQLLADIAMRKVDVVVVYKVDRLTRALADFAKIVEIFDGHGVSFVSVTQAFNTTTSMGRLTLNVLLSFAQFEREVTGERIRDKIAASKKKGMWMGGVPPLGYRAHERTLVIDEVEAATVRNIFERYLALRSVHALKDELQRDGIRARPSKRTNDALGAPFSRGALYHLLSNRLYIGEIVHKDASYPGQHPAIIDHAMFDEVAAALDANRHERRDQALAAGAAPLTGIIFDGEGRPLSPVATRNRHGRVYRYYVSSSLLSGGRRDHTTVRISAPAVEALVLERVQRVLPGTEYHAAARSAVVRIEVDGDLVKISLKSGLRVKHDRIDADDRAVVLDDGSIMITAPLALRAWRGRSDIARAAPGHAATRRQVDHTLVKGLARAHALLRTVRASPDLTFDALGAAEGLNEAYLRRLVRLAFLAPDIQQAIVDGRQPSGVRLERLVREPLPLSWAEQRARLGFTRG